MIHVPNPFVKYFCCNSSHLIPHSINPRFLSLTANFSHINLLSWQSEWTNDKRWLNWVIAICNSIYTHPVYAYLRESARARDSSTFRQATYDNFPSLLLPLTHFYIYSNCIQSNFHDQNDVFIVVVVVVCHIHFFLLLPVVALTAATTTDIYSLIWLFLFVRN